MEKKVETYAVDLYHQTKNFAVVSKELNTHRKNIQGWVKQFSEDGMVGFIEKHGRKSGAILYKSKFD
ncbi:helix-turn-helix domain-containing protein [Bacillus sp. DTU_2020_1000418_1_SI_GHA_SEK_038]|uniref:helix-turn-helix domain-containing protein n=1 Tax=Bacillus sp. DTU_2020_1000418_1_SI_GHA_SEK_038 TaxID=3077585 RepID=UPI0028E80E8C|nr:helix-turn-helix domain-containing protein [Bacillus sp. DTU_2020_1000418_1_SI_GHA_SEK_038]WNS76063.1 helix-turn-helix domain-containing protein [Bacillus sp. DTU_2020_1000418_1_SI_GHA_SEK_038]